LFPGLLLAYLVLEGRRLGRSFHAGDSDPAVLPPLMTLACLGLFWSVAAGHVYSRPRYLLPLVAAAAVHLGVAVARLVARSRLLGAAAAVFLAALLAINVAGTLPRLRASADLAGYYRGLVRALEDKGIRTGYADFSLAAPVTMFTAERIVLSPAL